VFMPSPIGHTQTHVDEHGQLTIPSEYRDELGLAPGAPVFLVRVGQSLLVVPEDAEFEGVCDRLADFFQRLGAQPEDIMAELAHIRQEEFARRFPDLAGQGE
jgi:AbrB family looped-hinge helix DNA binding protein